MFRTGASAAGRILAFSLNLESGGDAIEQNILPLAAEQMKRGVQLSHEAGREIEVTFQAARNNLGAAASVFMTGDPRAAQALVEQKREFRRWEADAIRAHRAPLRTSNGRQALPLDLWRDIKRLNDHLVAGSAYPVLEASSAAGRAGFRTDLADALSFSRARKTIARP